MPTIHRFPLLASLGIAVLALLPISAGAAVGGVTEFNRGIPAGAAPQSITQGPDGNLWFTLPNASAIGRITPQGTITTFAVTQGAQPWSITNGPDGNLWFTELAGNRIGRITTAGVVTEFPIPTDGSQPWGIVTGPDGNLWFTEATPGENAIGRITPAGVITEFIYDFGASTIPQGITVGPDGNLWVLETGISNIAEFTTAGALVKSYDMGIPENAGLAGIVKGPDGNLWFTQQNANQIGRITPAGAVTQFPDIGATGPSGITVGPDGNFWVTQTGGNRNSILRITPTGGETQFTNGIAINAGVAGITSGPDGNVWFTEATTSRIGRLLTGVTPVNTVVPTVFGALAIGSSLGVNVGTWTNLPTGYGYAWLRCSAATGGTCQTVPGRTGNTYPLTTADQGRFIKVAVTASNLNGGTRVVSAASGQVPSSAFTSTGPRVRYTRTSVILTSSVRVGFAGRITQVATNRQNGRVVRRCAITRYPAGAGVVTVQCTMLRATRNQLKRESLRMTLTTTYTANGAPAATKVQSIFLARRG